MKIKSYRFLFRIVSYLADKTNGAGLFVKYKLLLGTLIIGVAGAACGKKKPQVSCYDISAIEPDSVNINRNDTLDSAKLKSDTVNKELAKEFINTPTPIDEEIPIIMCYDPIAPEPEPILDEPIVPVSCYVQIAEQPQDIPPIKEESIMLYGSVQHPPVSPVGDLEQFSKWVQDNIEYPQIMLENKIQGRTTVNFIIDTEGNITEEKVIKSISPDVDAEVLKVITSSEKWTPGWHRGKKVKTSIIIPVKFALPEE